MSVLSKGRLSRRIRLKVMKFYLGITFLLMSISWRSRISLMLNRINSRRRSSLTRKPSKKKKERMIKKITQLRSSKLNTTRSGRTSKLPRKLP